MKGSSEGRGSWWGGGSKARREFRNICSAVPSRGPAIVIVQDEEAIPRYNVRDGVHVLQDTATRSRSPGRRTRRFE